MNNLLQIKFNIKNHRKLIITWLSIIIGFILISILNIKKAYPNQETLDSIFIIMQMPLMFMLFGNFNYPDNNTQAKQFVCETGVFAIVLIVIMNIILTVKMTRQKEDEGINDLILTTKVKRISPNATSYLIILVLNVIIFLANVFLLNILTLSGTTFQGNLVFSLGLFIIGFLFQNIAFLISEIASNASNSKSLSFLVFGILFIFRMFADYRFLSLQIVSPLSWLCYSSPYLNNYFIHLIIGFILSLILLCLSVFVHFKRDIGGGLIREFKGKERASRYLNNQYFFRLKLNKSHLIIWSILLIILGLLCGSLIESINHFSNNPVFIEILQGDSDDIISMMKSLVNLIVIMILNLTIIGGLKIFYQIKQEQYANLTDLYYCSKIKRFNIYFSHLSISIITSLSFFFINIVAMFLVSTKHLDFNTFFISFFNYIPVIFVVYGLSTIFYIFTPKLTYLSYVIVAIMFCLNIFGKMFFNLPDFINKIFVIGLLNNCPVEQINYIPWSILLILSIIIFVFSGYFYHKKSLNNLLV